ncbi:MAG: hypothetical protein JSR37_04870 [Verrucomicrobia bacterium]|nr:hypothetical protein [Verrucomicrobiota bacterium]MBS0637662.1 hypothetical protein [Verrucomicrobiota bacterium]
MSSSDQTMWSSWVVPPFAAGAAIIPPYYGFVVKTAQQLGQPVPKMGPADVLRGGCRIAPTVAGLVGMQMIVQGSVEQKVQEVVGHGQGKAPTMFETAASSFVVGALSSPAIAVFNGQAAGQTPLHALRNMSFRQFGAISVQETAFVMGMSASRHINDVAKGFFGDGDAVQYGSSFVSGAIGSLAGHPANTALTRWQNGLPVQGISQLARGAPVKAMATGLFAAGYHVVKDLLNKQ